MFLGPGSDLLWDCSRIPLDVKDVLADCLGESYNQVTELSLEILKYNRRNLDLAEPSRGIPTQPLLQEYEYLSCP